MAILNVFRPLLKTHALLIFCSFFAKVYVSGSFVFNLKVATILTKEAKSSDLATL